MRTAWEGAKGLAIHCLACCEGHGPIRAPVVRPLRMQGRGAAEAGGGSAAGGSRGKWPAQQRLRHCTSCLRGIAATAGTAVGCRHSCGMQAQLWSKGLTSKAMMFGLPV